MQNPVQTQIEKTPDHDSLLLASLIVRDVHHLVRDIQIIVVILLRYVTMGVSITDNLMELMMPAVSEEL